MSVVFLFLDGVGLGQTNADTNPVNKNLAPLFSSLLGITPPVLPAVRPGSLTTSLAIDANLGVEGLPQSGTGQTALFTGVNASKMLGRHFGPYPHSSLRPLLHERNLLGRLVREGKRVCFANAFPERFFQHMAARPSRLTVTTLSCSMSGIPLMTSEDLMAGRALSADITNEAWPELGYPMIQTIPAREAGKRLASLAREYDLVLFEYWRTDHAGHAMDRTDAAEVLRRFDGLLDGFLRTEGTSESLLVITSDHGNLEDLSVKVHTRNPVPLVLHGEGHRTMSEFLGNREGLDLTCVTPAILRYLGVGEGP